MPIAFFFDVEGLWLALLAGCLLITLYRLVELVRPSHRTGTREVLLDVGAGAFVQVYVAFMAGFYVALTGSEDGQWWTLAVAHHRGLHRRRRVRVGPHASAGTRWRPSSAPARPGRASPARSWSRVAFGAVLAPLMLQQPWWVGAIMGVLLALVGTAGDLTESLIKRDLGIKDISTWLPGHGGFLDRLDSILPSAAVAYVIYLIVT